MNASDFLSIRDFTPAQIHRFLDLARQIKAIPAAYTTALKGKTLAMIFEKPSLRTRVTFDIGIQQLGGFSLYLSPAEINLGKRESVYDVAKNLERMVQGIMIRTFAHEIVERMAEYLDRATRLGNDFPEIERVEYIQTITGQRQIPRAVVLVVSADRLAACAYPAFALEELMAEPGTVLREGNNVVPEGESLNRQASFSEAAAEHLDLGAFTGSVHTGKAD